MRGRMDQSVRRPAQDPLAARPGPSLGESMQQQDHAMRALDETDHRILDAAIAHFARDGYGRTVVESVAATAGVGNGTIYRRFENKEKLFFAALRHCLDSASIYVRQHI